MFLTYNRYIVSFMWHRIHGFLMYLTNISLWLGWDDKETSRKILRGAFVEKDLIVIDVIIVLKSSYFTRENIFYLFNIFIMEIIKI